MPFNGSKCFLRNYYRIKNIATGLFLCIEGSTQVELTNKGSKPECFFQFEARENSAPQGIINYGQLLQLKTLKDYYIQIKDKLKSKNYNLVCGKACLISTKMLWQL